MYFNNKILKPDLPNNIKMEMACEAIESIRHEFKEEYTLRDKYFPYIESFLPKTEHILFRYISKYEDKHSELLNSPYPLDQIPFDVGGEDANIVFKCTRINRDELMKDIKAVPLPASVTEKAAFQPLQVVLLLIVRYYIITKQPDKCNAIYYYYGYSIYWNIYRTFFKKHGYAPRKETMIYTVNELDYKSTLKKLGSVREFIKYDIQNVFEVYVRQMIDCCDEDIRYIIDQNTTRLRTKVRKLCDKYMKNYEKKEVIFQGVSTLDDMCSQRIDTSISAQIEVLAQKYTNKFFMTDVDANVANQAKRLAKDPSSKEVKIALENIKNNATVEEVYSFYAALFYIYLNTDDANVTIASITSLKFFAVMKDVFRKGNSTNPNIIKIRELMDSWLERSSNVYRIATREPTKTGYRRAIYYYFILMVTINK